MVYVWGSNSSHQLAEGTLEKILQPKLAQGFSDAQMVLYNPVEPLSHCRAKYDQAELYWASLAMNPP